MPRKPFAAVALSLLLASPAFAITYGVPDDGDHPNVGGVIVEEEHRHLLAREELFEREHLPPVAQGRIGEQPQLGE